MNILVLGRNGQLGQCLQDVLPRVYPNAVFWGRQQLDLEQVESIESRLSAEQPEARASSNDLREVTNHIQ